MVKRLPVSSEQPKWFNNQEVDDSDLTLEQDHNDSIQSGIIGNHIGTGILPEVLVQNILFDSALHSGFLDGIAISSQNQPADSNFGNQLEIQLQNSKAASRKTIKVGIIGLDFQSNLQYETFYFKANETQIGRKHFTKILVLLFNDFSGDPELSFNLGGRILIKEARPMTLSRSPIMVAQDVEPNLFFRDFFVDGPLTVLTLLRSALPLYNVDTLNILMYQVDNKALLNGDVTSQIGQKFIAKTNNIQKVQLLLSVRNQSFGAEDDLVWNGDLVVSIYPLQSNIDCPSDIAPNLDIDFSPSNIPVAQISFNYASLQAAGIVLDSIPQPVDFVFSNSPIAAGNVLVPGAYYAVAIKRAGSANKCDILIASGTDQTPDSRITTFTGSLWVDLPEEDLWFRIWTDAAKVSDGQAYESGHGIAVPKTYQDPNSLTTADFSLESLQFTGNEVFRAVVAADTLESDPIPDQRTGNPVLSKKEFVPKIDLLNTIDIVNLEAASDPLLIGAISDKNKKFFDSISSLIASKLYSATIVDNELIIKIIDDQTDIGRYDTSVNSLVTNLLNGDFAGAKIFPNANNPSAFYRIASAKLSSGILGDVNGDGQIDSADLDLLASYYDYNLSQGLPANSIITTDGYMTTFQNGYNTYNSPFVNSFGLSFQLVNTATNLVVAAANDGVLIANPNDPRLAQFTSASIAFNLIVGLSSYKLVVIVPGVQEDNGAFDIVSIDSINDVLTLRKVFLNGEAVMQMLRADIDGDFHITYNDGYLLQSYIDKVPLSSSPTSSYPAPSTNSYNKIGTRFNILRFKLEKFIDRADDYTNLGMGRATSIHEEPDIFLNDGYFASHDFYTYPASISIQKQLNWDESLIVSNSQPKLVPSTFTTLNGFLESKCFIPGVNDSLYASEPSFDPGRVDVFAPNNVIIGQGGELQRPDGHFYKVDFEVGTIILEIPDGLFGSERTINIMDDFIADYTGDGRTCLGFPSMKFADCSLVTMEALSKDQIRFSVAIQSFSPNTNGLSTDGYAGIIVDGKIGVSIDYATGLLTLNFTNLYQDEILSTLNTKVQIHVYIKKGGFNNQPLFVNSTKVQNMLKLVSVFSGSIDGGPSALVDIENDISGILPIVHGGTGLNVVGPVGTILTSTGSGLSYQFPSSLLGTVEFSTGVPSAHKVPQTDGYGLLDPSFYYKNPVYIHGVAGIFTNDGYGAPAIGAFTFRFDKFILQGIKSINLEVILQTTNASFTPEIKLYNVNTASYLVINGASTIMSTNGTVATYVVSDDLKNKMAAGATNYVYEIQLNLNPANSSQKATCKMARLVINYYNPYTSTHSGPTYSAPPGAHSWNFVANLPSPDPV